VALSKKETDIVKQVTKRYGNVIDLNKSPAVLIEILRNFGTILLGEGGAPGAPPSTMAVGVTPPTPAPGSGDPGNITLPAVMKVVLQMQRDVAAIKQTLAQRAR
jgi:hypothetical protein